LKGAAKGQSQKGNGINSISKHKGRILFMPEAFWQILITTNRAANFAFAFARSSYKTSNENFLKHFNSEKKHPFKT
jgi:hypothetical protein